MHVEAYVVQASFPLDFEFNKHAYELGSFFVLKCSSAPASCPSILHVSVNGLASLCLTSLGKSIAFFIFHSPYIQLIWLTFSSWDQYCLLPAHFHLFIRICSLSSALFHSLTVYFQWLPPWPLNGYQSQWELREQTSERNNKLGSIRHFYWRPAAIWYINSAT